jgi:hypothetical protein
VCRPTPLFPPRSDNPNCVACQAALTEAVKWQDEFDFEVKGSHFSSESVVSWVRMGLPEGFGFPPGVTDLAAVRAWSHARVYVRGLFRARSRLVGRVHVGVVGGPLPTRVRALRFGGGANPVVTNPLLTPGWQGPPAPRLAWAAPTSWVESLTTVLIDFWEGGNPDGVVGFVLALVSALWAVHPDEVTLVFFPLANPHATLLRGSCLSELLLPPRHTRRVARSG